MQQDKCWYSTAMQTISMKFELGGNNVFELSSCQVYVFVKNKIFADSLFFEYPLDIFSNVASIRGHQLAINLSLEFRTKEAQPFSRFVSISSTNYE